MRLRGKASGRGTLRPAALVSLLIVLLVAGGGLLTPASADVVTCAPMNADACKNTEPVATCVWNDGGGQRTVVWGYTNPTSDTAIIEVGSHNNVSPGAADQGQPTLFTPGTHTNAFWMTFTGSSASWRIGNNTVSTKSNTPACATKPVPLVGSMEALFLAAFALILATLAFFSARPRRAAVQA